MRCLFNNSSNNNNNSNNNNSYNNNKKTVRRWEKAWAWAAGVQCWTTIFGPNQRYQLLQQRR